MLINSSAIARIIYSIVIVKNGKQITPDLAEKITNEIMETCADFVENKEKGEDMI